MSYGGGYGSRHGGGGYSNGYDGKEAGYGDVYNYDYTNQYAAYGYGQTSAPEQHYGVVPDSVVHPLHFLSLLILRAGRVPRLCSAPYVKRSLPGSMRQRRIFLSHPLAGTTC